MIRLEDINKIFKTDGGYVHAVRDVNLTINDGEIFGIIGFSGAGKSTLVRCINLLERPNSGKVVLDDVDLMTLDDKSLREQRKKIGMIFQLFNLMPSRTVFENVLLPLRHSSLSKEQKQQKVLSLLDLVGLADRAESYPSQLSGGQKQRVAIARALANDPKVLLCDEATSALDPQTTQSILKLLKELNRTLGITIVVITHQMSVVKEICDRVAIMESGKVVEVGSIIDIFASPKDPVTRGFINTADNIDKLYELIESGNAPVNPDEPILLLTFTGQSSGQPLVSYLYKAFEVNANIIYGNVDFIQNQPLGKLAVALSGKRENIDAALEYIRSVGITVEVLRK